MPRNIMRFEEPWPRATMALVTLETVCVLVLESLVLREHILNNDQIPVGNALSTPNVIYPILYILATISVFTLCADAMYNRNQIQVIAFTFFNFLCFTYGIIQTNYDSLRGGASGLLKALNIAISVTIGVSSMFLVFAAYQLAAVFGWEMYRVLGADINMRKMYKGYEILITLLKFDVFFFVAYAVQMFTLVDPRTIVSTLAVHRILIGLAIPASIILLALAFFGVMKENRIATIFVMICLVAIEPYFIYQLVDIHLAVNTPRFANSIKYLTFFICVTMVLVFITLFFMIYCFRNFDKGLLILEKSPNTGPRKPFEIDGDEVESEPSMPQEARKGEDGASQQLMAYSALQKIHKDNHLKPSAAAVAGGGGLGKPGHARKLSNTSVEKGWPSQSQNQNRHQKRLSGSFGNTHGHGNGNGNGNGNGIVYGNGNGNGNGYGNGNGNGNGYGHGYASGGARRDSNNDKMEIE